MADSPPIYLDRTGARGGLRYFASLPEGGLYNFVKPFTKLFSGGAKELNMVEYADRVRKPPLLLIAGEKDPPS